MSITAINSYQNAQEGMTALQASSYLETDKSNATTAEATESSLNTEGSSSKSTEIVDSFIKSSSVGIGTDSGITMSNATYRNITDLIQSNKQASAQSAASMIADSTSNTDEDDEEETTTETITKADGSIYEKTTTTDSDGQETVTLVKVSDGKTSNETDEVTKHFDAAI